MARPVLLRAMLSALLATLPRTTVPAEFVTVSVVAVMAPVWLRFPPAVSATVLPTMPAAATSKPFESV